MRQTALNDAIEVDKRIEARKRVQAARKAYTNTALNKAIENLKHTESN